MDKFTTPAERIKSALAEQERSKSWLSRSTQIPLTTLDRKLRGDGFDLTLAQVHAICEALDVPSSAITPLTTDRAAS